MRLRRATAARATAARATAARATAARATAARATAARATAAVLVALMALAATGVPATAAPSPTPSGTGAPDGGDPDGGAPAGSLEAELATASRAYVDAQGRLNQAQQRQAELAKQVADSDRRLAELTASAGVIANRTYRAGSAGALLTVFNSVSPDEFVARALSLHELAEYDSRQLRELRDAKAAAATQRAELDQQIAAARTQADELARRKAQIQQAVEITSGGPTSGVAIPAPSADPAPRNPDGSFPDERCSEKDPTTSGCLTPRTLHALQQARAAGFTHYTACFRQATWGEHPLGRACDFAADPNGFGGIATGASRDYGNRLAGYLIANADRLGVLYVIWYHQVWTPAVGWHYYRGDGTPSGDHMNHVHLSER
jgi:peptidoglycan DL-endopeptidase CwlO